MQSQEEMKSQIGVEIAGEGYTYYQYDNKEYLEYITGHYDEQQEQIPYDHNEDEEGKFERVPLQISLIKIVLQTARFPERVLKRLERAITQKYLNLSGMGLTVTDLEKYIVPFLQNHEVKCLDISYNLMGDTAVELLCKLNLDALNISVNNLTDYGACLIAQKMVIKFLDVSNNKIGDKGAIALSQCGSLCSLDIMYNPSITEEGNKALRSVSDTRQREQKKPIEFALNAFTLRQMKQIACQAFMPVTSASIPPSPPVSAENPVIFTPSHKRALPSSTQAQERTEDSPPKKAASLIVATPQCQSFVLTATPKEMQELHRALQEAYELAHRQQSSLSGPP